MQRYSSQQFILLKTPRPAEREVRFRPAPDKSVHSSTIRLLFHRALY